MKFLCDFPVLKPDEVVLLDGVDCIDFILIYNPDTSHSYILLCSH